LAAVDVRGSSEPLPAGDIESVSNQGRKVMKTVRYKWLGRSLRNYKAMHHATARDKGVGEAFREAKTLTEAKKILFGVKGKQKPLRGGRKILADL
jgi:hypothetical protein